MKLLRSIKVVQFFLYEKEEIQLDHITGIFGPNAAGKSSMLDAAQIALVGASTRRAAFNAQADEGTTQRSLRDYCLGKFGGQPDQRARDNALTYITLVWKDSATGEPVSMGVCIEAAHDRDKHTVLGRYVVRGIELAMADHLEMVAGQECPRAWPSFRHTLLERAKISGDEVLFQDADRYIRAVLLALRGSGGLPSVDAWVRALRFGMAMNFKKSVDAIVRNDVLESRPTNIKKFKDLTDSFRELKRLVDHVEQKIKDAQGVSDHFTRATKAHAQSVTWAALAADVHRELANARLETATRERIAADATLSEAQESLTNLTEKIKALTQQAATTRAARDGHAAHQDYGTLQSQLDEATKSADRCAMALTAELMRAKNVMLSIAASPDLANLAVDAASSASAIAVCAQQSDLVGREALDRLLSPVSKLAKKAANELFTTNSSLFAQIEQIKTNLERAKENLRRTNSGRARLSDNVTILLDALKNEGLHPQPVCDLVRVSDPAWQAVIESYLGPNREALLIPTGEENQAFAVYRRLSGQGAVYGAKVAMEARQSVGQPPKTGWVAELIEGDDPAAVAFVRSRFGELKRATTDEDALAGGRCLTADGMLTSALEFERLRPTPPYDYRLGGGGADVRAHAQDEVNQLQRSLEELQARYAAVKSLFDQASIVGGDAFTKAVRTQRETVQANRDTIETLSRRLTEAADQEYVRLGESLRSLEGEIAGLQPEEKRQERAIGGLEEKQRQQGEVEKRRAQAAATAAEEARLKREATGFDAEFASDQWDKLLERFPAPIDAMYAHCTNEVERTKSNMNRAVREGSMALQAFLTSYQEQLSRDILEDWERSYAWVNDLLTRLRSTELVDYKERMGEAYRYSQETFRTDVAIALANNIEWMETSIERLNRSLRECPVFQNGERYQFKTTARPQLAQLLAFVKNVAAHGAAGDLFGQPGQMPAEFAQLLEEKVAPGAAGARNPLDDYREFYEFDIQILREDILAGKPKPVGLLSQRLGTGSGGEHRSPLYVIAGAAMASACRLDISSRNNDGLGLIMFDEAFVRMDLANMVATMRFMEALGLQVLMASPGENLGTLTAFLHRYYDIARDPDTNVIMLSGQNVSEETRHLYRSDLPQFHPDLIAEEVRKVQPVNLTVTATA